MKQLILLAIAASLAGCASSTSIRVSDPDARIYVNDEYVGTGRGHYEDRKPAFTRQEVTVRKDGCDPQSYSFRRNERPAVGAIVSAYYLYVPILWLTGYKDYHAFEFDCDSGIAGAISAPVTDEPG